MPEEKEWFDSDEAAKYLGINKARLARLRRQGRIQGIVGGGDNPRYAMYHISQLKAVDIRDLRKKNSEDEGDSQKTDSSSSSVILIKSRAYRALVGVS